MHHFIRTLAILIFPLLAGGATGGGGKAEKGPVREPPDIKSTQRTLEPAARPIMAPVIPPPEAAPPRSAPPRPAPPPPIKQACKVKKDSVEWVHISGRCK